MTGTQAGTAYAVGKSGVVLRNEGEAWEIMPTGEHDQLDAVAVDPCGGVHSVGYWSLILGYTE